MSTITVYVRLLDEGTDVFRPTKAERINEGMYRLLPTADYDAEDEHWEFLPGEVVTCQATNLQGARRLVVVGRA